MTYRVVGKIGREIVKTVELFKRFPEVKVVEDGASITSTWRDLTYLALLEALKRTLPLVLACLGDARLVIDPGRDFIAFVKVLEKGEFEIALCAIGKGIVSRRAYFLISDEFRKELLHLARRLLREKFKEEPTLKLTDISTVVQFELDPNLQVLRPPRYVICGVLLRQLGVIIEECLNTHLGRYLLDLVKEKVEHLAKAARIVYEEYKKIAPEVHKKYKIYVQR